jgi:ubiquinone/menaquinone biosynthesis C-methylase UbiE
MSLALHTASELSFDDKQVVQIFNDMRDEYDNLRDLWYAWLFSRLHYFIAKYVIATWDKQPRRVLDVGCGTGLQSFLYGSAGASVLGIDIADELIEQARQKSHDFTPNDIISLFPKHFDFVQRYDEEISRIVRNHYSTTEFVKPTFQVGNILDIPCDDASIDHLNCCGSVLSFVQDYNAALREMSRVLKLGGSFVLELEARFNMDLLWTLVDFLVRGKLGYEANLREAWELCRPPFWGSVNIEYPFGESADPVYMDIKLFTRSGFHKDLRHHRLYPVHWRSIHSVTNLIPSTILDTNSPSAFVQRTFNFLAAIEERCPFYLPGCSMVIMGKKIEEY